MKLLSSMLAALIFLPLTASAVVDTTTTAVLIVDMQKGFFERGGTTGTKGLESLIAKQMELLTWAVAEKVPVLVFEYDGFQATEPRLTDILKGQLSKTITKFNDDGFTTPSEKPAVAFLKKHGVRTIIMSGINGNACVLGTTTGAIDVGFDVVSSSDIVGNLNQYPPIYPNNTWYFKNAKFEIRKNLDEIIH